MKKRTIRHLLLLLPALFWPGVFFANSNCSSNAAPSITPYNCPAPPPDWIITTNVTPTSISLLWQAAQINLYYKVEGQDLTSGTPLPTYYVTTPYITYSSLTPGHTYRFDVSTSHCPGGPWGTERSHTQSTIIVDIIMQLQSPCTPNINRPTGSGTSYDYCVLQSTSSNPPYTNGFVGRLQYAGSNLDFGVALTDSKMHIGKIIGSQSFTFEVVNNGSAAVCKYAGTTLFTVQNLYFTNSFDRIYFTITFEGDYGNFTYCSNCNTGGGSSGGGMGKGHEENDGSDTPDFILTPQLAPNPFSESALFLYELTESGPVEIYLYDAIGQMVQAVEKKSVREPGQYEVEIDGTALPNGIYFLSVTTGQHREVHKLVKRE